MKTLWKVDITTESILYVMAETESEAEREAERHWPRDCEPELETWATPATRVDKDWADGQPYGQDKDDWRTCGEILHGTEEERAAAAEAARDKAEFDAHPVLVGMEVNP